MFAPQLSRHDWKEGRATTGVRSRGYATWLHMTIHMYTFCSVRCTHICTKYCTNHHKKPLLFFKITSIDTTQNLTTFLVIWYQPKQSILEFQLHGEFSENVRTALNCGTIEEEGCTDHVQIIRFYGSWFENIPAPVLVLSSLDFQSEFSFHEIYSIIFPIRVCGRIFLDLFKKERLIKNKVRMGAGWPASFVSHTSTESKQILVL